MLIEGTYGIGIKASIAKYGNTEQRYYQLLKVFKKEGISMRDTLTERLLADLADLLHADADRGHLSHRELPCGLCRRVVH